MRLLKTGTYLEEKETLELLPHRYGKNIPPYAILSHTWSPNAEDEVLFTDVENGTSGTKAAYQKVVQARRRARLDGYEYIWIDTCCVDKTSSVELSEAINSMFAYYQEAAVCYAHLVDVTNENFLELFPKSRWWERGWTLQELLAPRKLLFFSNSWSQLGSKQEHSMSIFQKTGIDEDFITGVLPVQQATVAQRMSWAADRETTREEDVAYCLMGLFKVNMPMLYGEGKHRAFIRLQEEIMRISDDQSLFAWVSKTSPTAYSTDYHGLLADSPADFKQSGVTRQYANVTDRKPYIMTNRGLNIHLPLTQKADGTYIAALQCPDFTRDNSDWLGIYLKKLNEGSIQYARIRSDQLASVPEQGQAKEIYVPQYYLPANYRDVYPLHLFHFRNVLVEDVPVRAGEDELKDYQLSRASRLKLSDSEKANAPLFVAQFKSNTPNVTFKIKKIAGTLSAGILMTRLVDDEKFILKLGSISEYEVGFEACEGGDLPSFEEMERGFSPRPAGSTWRLQYHQVQIEVVESVRQDQKIFSFDVRITPRAREKNIAEIVQDFAENFNAGTEFHKSRLFLRKGLTSLTALRRN